MINSYNSSDKENYHNYAIQKTIDTLISSENSCVTSTESDYKNLSKHTTPNICSELRTLPIDNFYPQ